MVLWLSKEIIALIGWFNRCKWNPISMKPAIAVKYDRAFLQIIDPEKTTLMHKEPVALEEKENCKQLYIKTE